MSVPYVPAVQLVQRYAPIDADHVPAPQGKHVEAFVWGLNVPIRHGSGRVAPAPQNDPGEQATQAVPPVTLPNEPAGHGRHDLAEDPLKVPGKQDVGQLVALDALL